MMINNIMIIIYSPKPFDIDWLLIGILLHFVPNCKTAFVVDVASDIDVLLCLANFVQASFSCVSGVTSF